MKTIVELQMVDIRPASGRGTTDKIFTMKEELTTCYEYQIPPEIIFIDFRKGNGAVNRFNFIKTTRKFNLPDRLIRLIKITLREVKSNVRVKGEAMGEFEIRPSFKTRRPPVNVAAQYNIRENCKRRKRSHIL